MVTDRVSRAGYYDTRYLKVKGGTIAIHGIDRTKKRVERLAKADKQALRAGMWKAGRLLLRYSKPLVPVDTGNLKASGRVKVLNNSDKQPELIVSYNTRYAVQVHEDLSAYHAVGQAKFLEEPARVYRKEFIRIIENEVERATDMSPGLLTQMVTFFGGDA